MSESGDFMILKDLIKPVVFDNVWTELNKEYSMKDGALEVYLKVFDQLKELTPGLNHDDLRLVVAMVEDKFEPGTFIFEVMENCIKAYGAAAVVAHTLWANFFRLRCC